MLTLIQHLNANRPRIVARLTQGDWFTHRKPNVEADRTLGTELFARVKQPLSGILDQLRAEVNFVKVDNRVSFGEAVAFIGHAVRLFYSVVQSLPADPAERKAVVLLAVDEFYTKEIAPLDIPYVPEWIENRFVDPMVGGWFHDAASALYDVILDAVENVVIGLDPNPPVLIVNPGVVGEQNGLGQAVNPERVPEAMGVSRDVGNAGGGRYAETETTAIADTQRAIHEATSHVPYKHPADYPQPGVDE